MEEYVFYFSWCKPERRMLIGVSIDNVKEWPADGWLGPIDECPVDILKELRVDNQVFLK